MLRLILNRFPGVMMIKVEYGITPLYLLCWSEIFNDDMLKRLLMPEYIGLLNIQDKKGVTPLHWLCKSEAFTLGMLKLLLANNILFDNNSLEILFNKKDRTISLALMMTGHFPTSDLPIKQVCSEHEILVMKTGSDAGKAELLQGKPLKCGQLADNFRCLPPKTQERVRTVFLAFSFFNKTNHNGALPKPLQQEIILMSLKPEERLQILELDEEEHQNQALNQN